LRLSLPRLLALLGMLASAGAAQTQTQTPPSVGQAVPLAAQTPPVANAQPLVVQDAWVRATPGADIAAAYMTLRNTGPAAMTVTGIQSPIAGHAMIHETKVEGGQSKMRAHEQLLLAPGATVKLQPGGLHVMLHDVKQPLTVGEKVTFVIQLSGGGTVQATATVRPLSAE
jgi:periplasmic copper chaperone A